MLARAMIAHGGAHDIKILLNSGLPDNIDALRREFLQLLPPENIEHFAIPRRRGRTGSGKPLADAGGRAAAGGGACAAQARHRARRLVVRGHRRQRRDLGRTAAIQLRDGGHAVRPDPARRPGHLSRRLREAALLLPPGTVVEAGGPAARDLGVGAARGDRAAQHPARAGRGGAARHRRGVPAGRAVLVREAAAAGRNTGWDRRSSCISARSRRGRTSPSSSRRSGSCRRRCRTPTRSCSAAGSRPGSASSLRATACRFGVDPEKIVFPGYIGEEDLAALYGLCAAFVVPLDSRGLRPAAARGDGVRRAGPRRPQQQPAGGDGPRRPDVRYLRCERARRQAAAIADRRRIRGLGPAMGHRSRGHLLVGADGCRGDPVAGAAARAPAARCGDAGGAGPAAPARLFLAAAERPVRDLGFQRRAAEGTRLLLRHRMRGRRQQLRRSLDQRQLRLSQRRVLPPPRQQLRPNRLQRRQLGLPCPHVRLAGASSGRCDPARLLPEQHPCLARRCRPHRARGIRPRALSQPWAARSPLPGRCGPQGGGLPLPGQPPRLPAVAGRHRAFPLGHRPGHGGLWPGRRRQDRPGAAAPRRVAAPLPRRDPAATGFCRPGLRGVQLRLRGGHQAERPPAGSLDAQQGGAGTRVAPGVRRR